jgi:DNA-binding phage protein
VSNYRTIREVEEECFHNHPEEIDDYITVLFGEYTESGDTSSLLVPLRVVGRVKGVSHIAEVFGLSRHGVQQALPENSDPQFGNINAILRAMGYCLIPQKTSTDVIHILQ